MIAKNRLSSKRLHNNILAAALLLILSAGTLTASGQNIAKPVTLHAKTQTREEAIKEIKAQTGYNVVFNARNFDRQGKVNFGETELALADLLDKIIEGTGQKYTIDSNLIIIFQDKGNNTASKVSVVSDRVLAGTVTDAITGEPVEGVKIELIDMHGKQAATFANGRFSIADVPSGNHIVKLTPADGGTARYREVEVTAGSDADVTLTLGGDVIQVAENTEAARRPNTDKAKTTAYFVPATVPDNTIRAFTDDPKTSHSLVPVASKEEYLPKAAVKTNLLIWGTATPNIGVEFGLAPKWTLDVSAAYNPFQLQKGGINRVGIIQPELRYWFCQRFEKHFIGLHGLYGRFNIGQVTFLTSTFEEHRYKGWGAGAGISYGYHLPMRKRWAWEFTIGAGYVYLDYDKYRCYECDEFAGSKKRHYFGPTKAGVSLIFMIK